MYNKVYNKTTFGIKDLRKGKAASKKANTTIISSSKDTNMFLKIFSGWVHDILEPTVNKL